MGRRTDIKTILLIGSGPIIIGQACEFDYSGTQASKVLRSEGYRVVLLNSNPATIMTDPEFADATYLEPITAEVVEQIIRLEAPDALLPTLGGQTALNVTTELAKAGTLEKYGVELIGAGLDAIEKAEDRGRFKETMEAAGLDVPQGPIRPVNDRGDGCGGRHRLSGDGAPLVHTRRRREPGWLTMRRPLSRWPASVSRLRRWARSSWRSR